MLTMKEDIVDDNEETLIEEFQIHTGNYIYPPVDVTVIRKMTVYLLDNYRIPLDIKHNIFTGLVSIQTCILTLNTTLGNVSTNFVKSEECGLCYGYQEHQNGIHRCHDVFLIGTQVCFFFRESTATSSYWQLSPSFREMVINYTKIPNCSECLFTF